MIPAKQSELTPILTVSLQEPTDIVTARQRARQLSAEFGFSNQEQVRFATAVSEIARNAQQAQGGRVEFLIALRSRPQVLHVRIADNTAGVAELSSMLEGSNPSAANMGLTGTRRLMDLFHIEPGPGRGAVVHFGRALPSGRAAITADQVRQVFARLNAERPAAVPEEIQRQNRELMETLESLRIREAELDQRQAELRRLNSELEETNRGVVALYAELDERALALRRADDLKSRFLSHVSHEFRTPLNSILALANLLLRRADGDLTAEQDRQVGYIRKAAQDLIDIVNDLLDLAKVESGKTEIHASRIEISQLFGAVRGIMRPLVVNEAVALVFEDPPEGLSVISDESKVAQILRNLVSNALKFTERGSVRVWCIASEARDNICISVADTGIGIAQQDQAHIFQEFTQVQNRLQRRVKGTGLGLPLSRKLAELLGGKLEVTSSLGEGSTFTLTLPSGSETDIESEQQLQRGSNCILIIDDEEPARYLARHLFRGTARPIIEASSGIEGAERARFERPALIVLDLIMPGHNGFEVLDELKADPATRDIPVVIHTSKKLNQSDYERLGGRHVAVLSKDPAVRAEGLMFIRALLGEPYLFAAELESESNR